MRFGLEEHCVRTSAVSRDARCGHANSSARGCPGPCVSPLLVAALASTLSLSACDRSETGDTSEPVGVDAAQPFVDAGSMDAAVRATGERLLDASMAAVRFSKLIDNQGWARYDASLDPLPSHEPPAITCQDSATYVEYGSFEIDSTRCNYLLAEHPAQRALPLGTAVRLNFLHYDLLAPESAEAHVALFFSDALQWETFIPIPSVGGGMMTVFNTTKALALGEPIRLHLHNHGGNTYLLVALEAAE